VPGFALAEGDTTIVGDRDDDGELCDVAAALWYASRATGVVAMVLLSVVVVLGIVINSKGRLPGLPRFAVTGLHPASR